MILRYFLITSISLFAAIFIFCEKPAANNSKPVIAVSIPPQKYFVEKIAGDQFDIIVMIPPGASPHTYEPKPSQMVALSKAELYFTIGVEFEKAWLERLSESYPHMIFIATDSGIVKIPLHDGAEEMPATEDTLKNMHRCEGLDPHIWLSPQLVRQQAATITRALCKIDPAHAALFIKNDSLFGLELSALQDTIRQNLTKRKEDLPFLVFHPSWGYFAHEFGLRQISIEVQGKEPTPGELGSIVTLARKSGTKTIYVQPQFSQRTAQTIAADIGARVVIADPLSVDWETTLIRCARALEAP